MREKTILLSIAIFSTALSFAQNFTGVYDFADVTNGSGLTDPTVVPTATGVSFGNFSAIGASANSNAANRFSFTSWPIGATTADDMYSSLTGSVNTSEYYEVTIGSENDYTFDLTDIKFSVQRSSTGIRTYVVRSSIDGFAANLPASIELDAKLSVQMGNVFFWNLDATTTNQNGSIITLGSPNFTDLTAPVTFRFYGYNSEKSTGTFSLDDVTFRGTAYSVATSVANKAPETEIEIFPNPSVNGIFTVNVSSETIIIIQNILGKTILKQKLNSFSNNNIDLSAESNGSYFVTLKNIKESSIKKVIISK